MKRSRYDQNGVSGNSLEALRPRNVCPITTNRMPSPRTESTHSLRRARGGCGLLAVKARSGARERKMVELMERSFRPKLDARVSQRKVKTRSGARPGKWTRLSRCAREGRDSTVRR